MRAAGSTWPLFMMATDPASDLPQITSRTTGARGIPGPLSPSVTIFSGSATPSMALSLEAEAQVIFFFSFLHISESHDLSLESSGLHHIFLCFVTSSGSHVL